MKTITLFNAYTIARNRLHDACVDIAGNCETRSELFAATREAIRRERQCQSLDRAIRARIRFPELDRKVHTRLQEVQP